MPAAVVPAAAAPSLEASISIAAVVAAVAALAVLVLLVWRRSSRADGGLAMTSAMRAPLAGGLAASAPPMVTAGAHGLGVPQHHEMPMVSSAPMSPEPPAPPAPVPAAPVYVPAPIAAHGSVVAAAGPHPSGLGAVELAAQVEEGLVDLAGDIAAIERILADVDRRSSLPDDLPELPAVEQRRLATELAAELDDELARARTMAEAVAADLVRADRALGEVRAELVRIGLRPDFFVRMDAAASALARAIPGLQMPVAKLERRFVALSALFSTLRPVSAQLEALASSLTHASAATAAWRADVEIDLRDPVRY